MKLARSKMYSHPQGEVLKTPQLIPSFSTKGFRVVDGQSIVKQYCEFSNEFLVDTVLYSAYDIYHGYLPDQLAGVEITFIDSGGYETSGEHDLSTILHSAIADNPWDADMHSKTLADWPELRSAVFVSYDRDGDWLSFDDQVARASQLATRFPKQMIDFLIKPETPETTLGRALEQLYTKAESVRDFHIIGVTEKELGDSILERMVAIARLRMALDEKDIDRPIHVFGSLDPLACKLYFVSGAELFDGLTWLRYGYRSGLSIYMQSMGAIDGQLRLPRTELEGKILWNNSQELKTLSEQMTAFANDDSPSRFQPLDHGEVVEKAYAELVAELGGEPNGR